MGIALAAAAFAVSSALFFWMTPVIIGLLFAIPTVAVTSQAGLGIALRRAGLFLIPEEEMVPPILYRANALAATNIQVICPWCRPSAFRPRSFSSPSDRDWLRRWSELSWPAGFRLEWRFAPAVSLPVSLRLCSAATSFERSSPVHSIEARSTVVTPRAPLSWVSSI